MKITHVEAADGFYYSDAPQKSPEWLDLHTGRVGASQLHRWLAVGKRDGKPLKARLDYERELAFEKAFHTSFNKFVTPAMQEGIDNEAYVRDQYSSQVGVPVETCGGFYNDQFIASPDGLIGDGGCLEIKWLQDTNWTEVVTSRKPYVGASGDHYLQMQGQLLASGRAWCDYVAANGNTGRFIVIRIERNEETIEMIRASLADVELIKPLDTYELYEMGPALKTTTILVGDW